MKFFEVIKNRTSIRSYSSKEIEEEKLQKILDVINSAPSAGNLQSYRVIVVKDKNQRNNLAASSLSMARKTKQTFISEAPISLVFLAIPSTSSIRYGKRGSSLYSIQDATIAAAYAQLAATSLGLSSVWVGSFNTENVSKLVNAKQDEIPIAIIPIGYSNEESNPTTRKSKEELFFEM